MGNLLRTGVFVLALIASIFGSSSILASPLIEGKEYRIQVGQNNIGGVALVRFVDGKYQIRLPVVFAGGLLFGLITPEEVKIKTGRKRELPREFFQPQARGITEIEALRNRIEKLVRSIEASFESEYVSLDIEPNYLADERSLLDKETLNDGVQDYFSHVNALNRGLQKSRRTEMKVLVSPTPNPHFISPTHWDVMDAPAPLLAHEVGHILGGTIAEGFMHRGYPLNGLMADEYSLRVLQMLTVLPCTRLYEADFHSIMFNLLSRVRPQIAADALEAAFPHRIEKKHRGLRYSYSTPHHEKIEILKREWHDSKSNRKPVPESLCQAQL